MADNHSKEIRSFNMSRIKSKNTAPELIVRKFLFSEGFRYRLHDKKLNGKPDIILPKYKTLIFVHGCFWHCHKDCKRSALPKSRKEYWIPKLERNASNDLKNIKLLKSSGWHCIVVWECSLKKMKREKELGKLKKKILGFKV